MRTLTYNSHVRRAARPETHLSLRVTAAEAEAIAIYLSIHKGGLAPIGDELHRQIEANR